jgi:uracil-DNA glycosylase
MIVAAFDQTLAGWRDTARRLLEARINPAEILWSTEGALFDGVIPDAQPLKLTVPREFVSLAEMIACHREESRWSTLYRVLYRIVNGERHLLAIESDPDVNRLYTMRKQVAHDMHRMKAFVRFREVDGRYVAWHRPDHHVLDTLAPWFVQRFGNMRWSILTPDRSAHWDLSTLEFGPGVPASEAPSDDALEELWRAYYASTFNPARVNEKLLRTHLPGRYWTTMPESAIIPNLIVEAKAKTRRLCEEKPRSAADFIPTGATLPILRQAVRECRGCDLHERATQAVFGEGPANARLVLVAEQPGDQEDLAGRPFVGPSGQLLDRALAEVGLIREEIYITGAVKHFRYEPRGKQRIHKTASRSQIAACQPWLEAELALIRPKLIVCMGNTALLSVVGRAMKISDVRGQLLPHRHASAVTATVHPSYLLRVPERQEEEYRGFLIDLDFARKFVA